MYLLGIMINLLIAAVMVLVFGLPVIAGVIGAVFGCTSFTAMYLAK